jgi:uncharacterized membrane protein
LSYRSEFRKILVQRLFIGSVTGWVFLVLLLPVMAGALWFAVVRRASISLTDLIVDAVEKIDSAITKWFRKDFNVGWSQVTSKIVTMRVVAGRTASLTDCAA